MSQRPLTFDQLDAYLSSDDAPEDCMQVSDIDGFLTALVIGPASIHPDVWFPTVWGSKSPKFQETDRMGRAVVAIADRYNDISAQLANQPDRFAPLYWRKEDGTVIAADWAEGFLDAMKLDQPGWDALFASEDHRHLLLPILVHCGDENGDSLLGLPDEQEEILITYAYQHIPEAVIGIRDFFMPRRVAAARRSAATFERQRRQATKRRRR